MTNSFWYGVEMLSDTVVLAVLSIVVARALGPEQLGHFVYLALLTNVVGRLGGLGMTEAARKYMTQHFAEGRLDIVRAVFFLCLRIQGLVAVLAPAIGLAVMYFLTEPEYRVVSTLLVLSIAPSVLGSIAAMANVGSENFSKNVPSALFGLAVYVTIILLTLYLDWQLVGLAAAVFLRRFTEAMLRLIPVIRSMMKAPKCTTSPDLMPRVLSFSGQAFAITLLTLVVWDRSEVLFLKHFADVRQLAYYSVGFSLTEYILMIPTVLGGALGAALMAEYSRSREGVQTLTSNAIRHLSLVILPVHVGVAVVSAAVIPLAYGPAYHAAAPVLATAAILAIPKGFYWLPMTVFQATERQTTTVRWLVATAVVNISLDFLLIPRFGAMGAAIANGFSQCFAVCGMWYSASKIVYVRPPWSSVIRLVMAALVMGAVAFAIVYSLPPVPAICCAIPAGVVTYVLLVRQFRVLDAADILPLGKIAKRLPGPAARIVVRLSRFMAPAANATQTAAYRAAAGT